MTNSVMTAPASVPVTRDGGVHSGVSASVTASVGFAALFAVPGFLTGLDPFAVVAWRVIAALPFLAVILSVLGTWPAVRAQLARIRRRPVLALVLVADAALFGLQIFLFGWGPATGHALHVSLGYFLLPLVMVVLGVVLFGERLSRWRTVAVALAAAGVAVALITGSGISWATFAVALGYPAYFLLRRRFGLDSVAGLALEMAVLAPIALVLLARPSAVAGLLSGGSQNVIGVVALGLLTAIGFSAYSVAQRILPFGLFGLLGYLEPVLLVVVSTLVLAEPLGWPDVVSYAAMAGAIVALGVEGWRRQRHASGVSNGR